MKKYKYTFYLPQLDKYWSCYAKDEGIAVWKLLNQYYLREKEIMDYKICGISLAG